MTQTQTPSYSKAENVARDYYNSTSADRFYDTIWGGEDIHVGLYKTPGESIFDASRRTVEKMISILPELTAQTKVLDVGAGYGGSGRMIAKQFGAPVTCLNLSDVQNRKNRELNAAAGLADKVDVVDGSFEELPFSGQSFDIVWSQDAFLHSGRRRLVLEEVNRVLKPGGRVVFTDPMQADDCSPEDLKPVLDRIHLDTMGSPGFYRQVARELGWVEADWLDMTEQLVNHYGRVRQEVVSREEDLARVCEQDYIDRMKIGLQHWVDQGKAGNLKWGIFLFQKP